MRGPLWRGVAEASFLRGKMPPGERVWDLGCGDGKFLQGLHDAGFRPVGMDFSGHALTAARRRLACGLLKADVRRLPLRSGAAPAIVARYVVGAVDEAGRREAAADITRALAPGGLLVVEEFSQQDFRFGDGHEVEPGTFERNRGILTHYFEEAEVPRLFGALTPEGVEALESVQRVGARRAKRHRYRWFLRAPASKSSSGAAAAGER